MPQGRVGGRRCGLTHCYFFVPGIENFTIGVVASSAGSSAEVVAMGETEPLAVDAGGRAEDVAMGE